MGLESSAFSQIVDGLIAKGIIEKMSAYVGIGRPVVLYQLKGQKPSVKHEFYVNYLVQDLRSKGTECVPQRWVQT